MDLKEFFAELFVGIQQPHPTRKEQVKQFCRLFIIASAVNTVVMICYIGYGHDKEWPSAAVWHECIHGMINEQRR